MKNIFVFLIVIVVVLSIFFGYVSYFGVENKDFSRISINGEIFDVEVVRKQEDLALGLSGRSHIEDKNAMVFVFDKEDFWGIWMKDMNFPIDVVWLDKNKKIIFIKENLKPETFPEVFYPDLKALYVVEMSVDSVKKTKAKINDEVFFLP